MQLVLPDDSLRFWHTSQIESMPLSERIIWVITSANWGGFKRAHGITENNSSGIEHWTHVMLSGCGPPGPEWDHSWLVSKLYHNPRCRRYLIIPSIIVQKSHLLAWGKRFVQSLSYSSESQRVGAGWEVLAEVNVSTTWLRRLSKYSWDSSDRLMSWFFEGWLHTFRYGK